MFRDLNKDDIDVRVATCKQNGVSLLLYKDARVDMDILDESVGPYNWKREHTFKEGKLYCSVSIWDKEKQQWIIKSDCGTESNTEKEKGEASDSFKRACVNWGIGRELYTAPFIWVKAEDCKIEGNKCYDKFVVAKVVIENKRITAIAIRNATLNKRVFVWQEQKQ